MAKWDKEYLKLCRKILTEGVEVENRTGINTIKIPGYNFMFDLSEEFPFLTTKQLYYKAAIKELMWIYQVQSNDVRWLQERNVHIWDEWEVDEDGIYRIYYPEGKVPQNAPSETKVYYNTGITGTDGREIMELMYVTKSGKVYKESDPKRPASAKPMTTTATQKAQESGRVLRSARYFGPEYAHTIGHAYGYTVNFYKLLDRCINLINACKIDPTISDGRRNIICLWQENDIKDAVLKPCVFCSEWDVTDGKLNATVHQRSCDVPLGLPFNVTQYSVLLYLLAHITGLEPGTLNWSIKDAHIYKNQVEGIEEQLSRQDEIDRGEREDIPAPELWIDPEIKCMDDIDNRELSNVKVLKYRHHGPIKFPLAQ